jgi:hypothetical protein
MNPPVRRASAHRRRNRILICPVSVTTSGVGITSEPVFDIEANDASGLGEATLAALQKSKKGVPHPTPDEWLDDPILKAAGIKSWSAFAKSAKNVIIRFETNRVVFVPTKNLGPRDGFVALPERERSSAPTVAEVGSALLAAFEDAE